MRLVNKTQFETKDLRKILTVALKFNGMDPKHYWIQVNYRRKERGGFYGHGSYNQERMWLHLNPAWKDLDNVATRDPIGMRDLAETINHEVAHNRGLRHKDMKPNQKFSNRKEWERDTEYIVGLPLRVKVAAEKSKADPVATREAHARKMLQAHEVKLRRQQRIVRKWRTKVKYYERKNAVKNAAEKKGV